VRAFSRFAYQNVDSVHIFKIIFFYEERQAYTFIATVFVPLQVSNIGRTSMNVLWIPCRYNPPHPTISTRNMSPIGNSESGVTRNARCCKFHRGRMIPL